MNTKLTLTRYLYFADEVCLSLLDCLIEQRDLNEALFWVDELFMSGFVDDIWMLLWKIYFDFYAIKYPYFMKRLSKYWKTYKQKKQTSVEQILSIVKSLFQLKSCYQVFLFRIKNYEKPLTVYSPETMTTQKKIIKAIKNKEIANLRYFIESCDLSNIDFLKNYFRTSEKSVFEFYEYPKSLAFHFTSYYILSHFDLGESIIARNMKSIKHIGKKEMQIINDIKKDDVVGCMRYKVLAKKRIYGISKNIGCFEKYRDEAIVFDRKLLSVNEIYWYHWLYFTVKTPLWQNRIVKYNGEFDVKSFTVVFPDDDKLEAFYETYGLEPDEQSQECQDKSLVEIPDKTPSEWLKEKFDVIVDTRCDIVNYKI